MVFIKTFFIKEADKPSLFKHVLTILKIQNDEIIIQPNLNQKQTKKAIQKIKKICKKRNVQNIALSRELQNDQELANQIIASQLNIFDGRWLANYMAYEIVSFVIEKANKIKEETEITILSNFASDEVVENIKLHAKEFKRINIVTNHINRFKYLEDKIFDEYGMMITVTNNKRKSLAKAEIILNFDFINETINKYNIYENAIIINLEGDIKIDKKRFNGLNINNFEVTSKKAYDHFEAQKLNNFYLRDLLESKLYRKDAFTNIRKDITGGFYKIKELYGNNGKLF